MKTIFKTAVAVLVMGTLCLAGLAAAGKPKKGGNAIPVFGSSGKLEGTIAVVSIFMNDARTSWNFEKQEDVDMYGYVYYDLKIACEWLTKACRGYGRKVKFVWDWTEHEELFYSGSLSIDIAAEPADIDEKIQSFIRRNIDGEGIKRAFGANGIIYMVYVNTPSSNSKTGFAFMWARDYPRNEEGCFMLMQCDGWVVAPACFAHEMLHTFGAPDLYYAGMYGITQEYVDYVESMGLNDIMRTNSDLSTGEYVYDKVSNEITDITAYYVGLTNYSETVEEWGFEPSDYDR